MVAPQVHDIHTASSPCGPEVRAPAPGAPWILCETTSPRSTARYHVARSLARGRRLPVARGRRTSLAGRDRLTTPTDSGRIAGTLLGRTGEPDAVAATALVLACSDGSYFTGQWRLPNGRLLMG